MVDVVMKFLTLVELPSRWMDMEDILTMHKTCSEFSHNRVSNNDRSVQIKTKNFISFHTLYPSSVHNTPQDTHREQ